MQYYTQLLATKHSPECLMTMVTYNQDIHSITGSQLKQSSHFLVSHVERQNKPLLWVCNIPVTQDTRPDHVQFTFKLLILFVF